MSECRSCGGERRLNMVSGVMGESETTNQWVQCKECIPEIAELQAHIERLREACLMGEEQLNDCMYGQLAEDIYAIANSVPKQSLAKHDAEVIRTMIEYYENNHPEESNAIFCMEEYLELLEQDDE